MIVVDTSAWVELDCRSGSPVEARLTSALEAGEELAVTEVVVAEVLSWSRDEAHLSTWQELLLGFPLLRLRGLADFEVAAALRRACHRHGESVRGIADCLVAVPAITAGAAVLHSDRDFDVLARHTPLQVVPLDE